MRIFRYEVPADDRWHDITLTGPIVRTACRNGDSRQVHFWALDGAGAPFTARLRVFGTGEQLPDDVVYRGTGIAEPIVLHLFEQA